MRVRAAETVQRNPRPAPVNIEAVPHSNTDTERRGILDAVDARRTPGHVRLCCDEGPPIGGASCQVLPLRDNTQSFWNHQIGVGKRFWSFVWKWANQLRASFQFSIAPCSDRRSSETPNHFVSQGRSPGRPDSPDDPGGCSSFVRSEDENWAP